MKVYAVYIGEDHEPGGIGGVFSTHERAETSILALGLVPFEGGYERGRRYAMIVECNLDESLET